MRWLRIQSSIKLLLCLSVSAVLLGACKAKYPGCEGDSDCPGNAQGKEFCVNGQCHQCRPDVRD